MLRCIIGFARAPSGPYAGFSRRSVEGDNVSEASANVTFFSGLLQTVADRGRALVGYRRAEPLSVERLLGLAEKLLTGRGEASGMALGCRSWRAMRA